MKQQSVRACIRAMAVRRLTDHTRQNGSAAKFPDCKMLEVVKQLKPLSLELEANCFLMKVS